MNQQTPILLSDEQVQRYIADGYIIVDSNLDPSFHASVTEQVAYALENEIPHPGDNIVPRVPALNTVCDAPAVRGALNSLLGNQFAFLPHRFPHNSEPLGEDQATQVDAFDSQPTMAKGSISASGWHQDGHASSGRSCWHTFRAANVFYFPHDTPLQMGPTRFLAGSHLYATLHDLCAEQAVMQMIPAGSVVIADFNLGHAGTPNYSNHGRYMVKFVALRTEPPVAPTWDHQDPNWHTPADLSTPHDLPVAWTSLWNWLRGADRSAGITAPDGQDLQRLLAGMRSASQQDRLTCLYDAAAMGAPAVNGLIDALLQTTGLDKHKGPGDPRHKAHFGMSTDHLDRFYVERQFMPEDVAIALGAIGAPAVPQLVELLHHEDPWIRLNAVYALGDAGPKAVGIHIDDVGALLADPEGCVIRVTLDALCALGTFGPEAGQQLREFLAKDIGSEESADDDPRLAMLNQIRYLSALALLAWVSNSDSPSVDVEAALIDTLDDENAYPPLIACLALEQLGSVDAMRAAIHYLRARCWDSAQNTRAALSGAWTTEHRKATLARLTGVNPSGLHTE
jgi:HEAT repeat protein